MQQYILSSDVLEAQFGTTAVEVLYQDMQTRVICTKVVSSGQILELSRVEFVPAGVAAFVAIHRSIVAGQSMGKAFQAHGIAFVRETRSVCRCTLPDGFNHRFGSTAQACVMVVAIFVGDHKTPYAHILETYSPEVTWPDADSEPTKAQNAVVQRFNKFLKTIEPKQS